MKVLAFTTVVFICLQVLLSQDFQYDRKKIYIGPSKNIKKFTFGYDDALSAAFWVRVVQDFHICDQNSEKTLYPTFTGEQNVLDEILTRDLPNSTCEKGWVFQMLDVISDLDPTFRAVYLDGATMLSVMVDDREGASKIFEKGIEQFPNDWEVLYPAAYHQLFEMQNQEKAEKLMFRAAEAGAPAWTYSLAAKLSSRSGRAAMALGVLEQVLDRDLGGEYSARIKAQIEKLKEVIRTNQGQ